VVQAFQVSRRTLMRRVKLETGMSPLARQRVARAEKAKHLLRRACWPVVRFVEAVGYSDPASFARLFAEQFGDALRSAGAGEEPSAAQSLLVDGAQMLEPNAFGQIADGDSDGQALGVAFSARRR
jgi:hypothetical protein